MKWGRGSQFYVDGQYDGNWYNNLQHGEGTITYNDYSKWVGPWKNGNKHGTGMFTDENGKVYMEEYKDGNLVERKLVENEQNTTQISRTSVESDSSLKEFIESIKKSQPADLNSKTDRSNVKFWTVDNVADWLEFIRMQQYTSLFVENCIDGSSLLNIKEKDLLNMGITSKGHRMSIREAIEKLRKITQPAKQKKIVIHAGHMKKRQACSLSSAVKLRGYYHSVKVIDEEENDGKSSDSDASHKSVKSTSGRVCNVRSTSNTLRSSGSDISFKEHRKLSYERMPLNLPQMLIRTQSAAVRDNSENMLGEARKEIIQKRVKTPKTPRKDSNFYPEQGNQEGTDILESILANKRGSNRHITANENSDTMPEHSMVAKRSRSSSVDVHNPVQLIRL